MDNGGIKSLSLLILFFVALVFMMESDIGKPTRWFETTTKVSLHGLN